MTDAMTEPVTDPEHEDAPGADTPGVNPTPVTSVTPAEGVVNDDTPDEATGETPQSEPETFPREYVEELRQENGKYRQRAQLADDLAARLHNALVAATGRLADPTDLPFDEAHLSDADALTDAVDALLVVKPHLAARKFGNIGQGASAAADTVSLSGLLRSNAG